MDRATGSGQIYEKLEWLTRQWWFYAALFVIPAILPPLTSAGMGYWKDPGNFVSQVTEEMYYKKLYFAGSMPILHLAVVIMIFLLGLLRSKFGRIFSFLVGINVLVMIFMQTYVVNGAYGLVIITELLTWYIVILLMWLWEARAGKTTYNFSNFRLENVWLIPLAVFAFWDPEVSWSFDPTYLWNSYAPTAFCMMAPIYLSVLVYQFPNINIPLFRVTSFTGVIMSVVTIGIAFFNDLSYAIYWLILHIPLIVISIYCFRMSFRPLVRSRNQGEVNPAVHSVIE